MEDATMHKRWLVLVALLSSSFMLPCHSEATGTQDVNMSYTITWNNQSNGFCHPLTIQVKTVSPSASIFEDKDVLLHNNTRSMTFIPDTALLSGATSFCLMKLSTSCYYRGMTGGLSLSSARLPCASGIATISTGGGITLTPK